MESLPFTLPDRVNSRREGGQMKPSAPEGGRDLQVQDGGKSTAHRPPSQSAPRGMSLSSGWRGWGVPGPRPPAARSQPALPQGCCGPVLTVSHRQPLQVRGFGSAFTGAFPGCCRLHSQYVYAARSWLPNTPSVFKDKNLCRKHPSDSEGTV